MTSPVVSSNPAPVPRSRGAILMRRLALLVAGGVLALGVLVAAVWLAENARGKAAWQSFRAEWEAKGADQGDWAWPAFPDSP